ncbi:DegT/DnrJ/EryC1/StrS family aminotransferase [Bradyrhizobium sp. 182]|uniref:DegT/DnrJ/EryC1/StrS family aminotransferase n=1 Tax=unclassified Bradyrhizobium TaxID=2631580 RepID=UPI001FFC2356|nr:MULTISPECIES: DegT/DnrJ/EryC1/StrS family aminotransferase [unclassified Bradyrhizobium]MCK1424845.1 DegT/DnrJ/EryC1/StrS family aminotransferase [Bradyrhizobium sp. CW12]MCK1531875.1 DegT/DnrJ/EryC1/StrS family aminotransferase [Bradyrhizobium sp. 182]MCK1646526.1 DegT/DnrJ/EryC1/StrS family aminotransferase [Bradyrhizobium sp. 154]
MIPFLDLKAQGRTVGSQIDVAIARAVRDLRSTWRPEAAAFEKRFADYCNVACCCAVNSGTSALRLALLAAGVGPGDEVITVSMNFVVATAAIIRCGATPVFVDVDPVTWTMNPALVEAAITNRTRAILPAHLHGLMADMDPIMSIARRYGLFVIEDASQAHGAVYKSRRAGSIGDLGCFSFYPDKNLGAYGEAGAVVTDQPELARRVSWLLDRNQDDERNHVFARYDDRMDELQAAVLNVKMDYIESWTETRRAIAAQYDQALSTAALASPRPPSHSRHVYHIYALRLQHRDQALAMLGRAGIGVGIHYAVPVHLQQSYVELGYRVGDLPVSERLAREFLSLPIYPELLPERAGIVASELRKVAPREAQIFRSDWAFQNKMPRDGRLA